MRGNLPKTNSGRYAAILTIKPVYKMILGDKNGKRNSKMTVKLRKRKRRKKEMRKKQKMKLMKKK